MTLLESYCCFWHPKPSAGPNSLKELCPDCQRSFGYPLENCPDQIAGYKVIKALSRGFYGSTYLVEKKPFNKRSVLKIIPKLIYKFFNKDFENECQLHHLLAQNCEHIVGIQTYDETSVDFGGTTTDCYYAELDYLDGLTLKNHLAREEPLRAQAVAQIAIDLYGLLAELEIRQKYHNDLHASNVFVQHLSESNRRVHAVEHSIRVVAIDLGSISDCSSSHVGQRAGDIGWIAKHVGVLADKLLNRSDISQQEFRLASLLKEHCCLLTPSNQNQRIPTYTELCEQVRKAIVDKVLKPWRSELTLTRFHDGYNAQTISSWHVPSLVIDPNEAWLKRLAGRGPCILTGLRGCGKTMILRSAELHARARRHGILPGSREAVDSIKKDGYIGLYTSATRLLGSSEKPFEKLLIAFARSACSIFEHLEDLDASAMDPNWQNRLCNFVADSFSIAEPQSCRDSSEIDRWLFKLHQLVEVSKTPPLLKTHASVLFVQLAELIRQLCPELSSCYVLFLLDDVSTRYLSEDKVREIVSELIFQSEICAFKFTTEAQTLELVLNAPGSQSPAWRGRDYEIFDLGSQVNELIKSKGVLRGEGFLEKVLITRAKFIANGNLPPPLSVLGDCDLSEIAKTIANTTKNSSEKKSVYHGLSALAGVCVGDIGDVVSLYDEMIRRHNKSSWPIEASLQSDCFQAFCSKKLFELSRRDNSLKDFALTFAQASQDLLNESIEIGSNRIRQYTKLYVSLTKGDKAFQRSKLRELLDAGIFTLDGGASSPRKKTKHSDPLTQFILSYRKLLGLSSFMPISDRDRFELRPEELEEWLRHPDKGREILKRRLTKIKASKESKNSKKGISRETKLSVQQSLPLQQSILPLFEPAVSKKPERPKHIEKAPQLKALSIKNVVKFKPTILFFGLGFEDRTYESLIKCLEIQGLKKAIGFRFPEEGHTEQMLKVIKRAGVKVIIAETEEEFLNHYKKDCASAILDVSGLPTSLIFNCTKSALDLAIEPLIVYSTPQSEFPTSEDIQSIFNSQNQEDTFSAIEKFRDLISGDSPPYMLCSLWSGINDPAKERALCAFASAKHERLFALLDQREFDHLAIGLKEGSDSRFKLAALATEVAQKNFRNVVVAELAGDAFRSSEEWLLNCYQSYFLEEGMNLEIALTGSKLQTISVAAVSSIVPIGQVWCIRPSGYDAKRFSIGYDSTSYFRLTESNK